MSRLAKDYDYMSFDDFEEFLADKPKNERWELLGGRVVKMMVGARWEHNRIVQNISWNLSAQFFTKGSSCQTFAETFYMKDRPLDAALLPDVMVVCGTPEAGATSVNDPIVVFEVLSTGTEARDRFDKWQIYQQLASLRHYVLVTRDKAHVEVMDRADGRWSGLRVFDGLDAVIDLPAVDAQLTLAQIYYRALG